MRPPRAPAPNASVGAFIDCAAEAMRRAGIRQQDLVGRVPYHPDCQRNASTHLTRSPVSRILKDRHFPDPQGAAAWYAQHLTAILADLGVPADDCAELEKKSAAIEVQLDAARSVHPSLTEELPEPTMLSRAAIEHFNLARHPFQDDVQGPEDVYLSREQRYIRESMWWAAKGAGMIAVVGESGSGKTTLRRDLIERIAQEGEPITVLQPQTVDKTCLSAGHICDAIILDMSSESPRQSLEAKARQVQRILADSSRAGNKHVLIIEEAHDLKIQTLKYLKRFWEMEDGFRKLLGIILVGQPELGDKLNERRNYEAREVIRRIEVATLEPLNGNLREYLALKFKRIGADVDRVLAPDAYEAIHRRLTISGRGQTVSYCYPLVVHNLLAKAMNMACELGCDRIDAELVRGV